MTKTIALIEEKINMLKTEKNFLDNKFSHKMSYSEKQVLRSKTVELFHHISDLEEILQSLQKETK